MLYQFSDFFLVFLKHFYVDSVELLNGFDSDFTSTHDYHVFHSVKLFPSLFADIVDIVGRSDEVDDISSKYLCMTARDDGLLFSFDGYDTVVLAAFQIHQSFVDDRGIVSHFYGKHKQFASVEVDPLSHPALADRLCDFLSSQ